MARSFYPVDREQMLLLPPSIADWVPEDDISRFIIDALDLLDFTPFYEKFTDGSGQTAYRPEVLLGLLVLAYTHGIHSSRVIAQLCVHDIRFRMISANLFPHYSTISRFRSANFNEMQTFFEQILRLCAEAGLVKLGIVALDGTKLKANAAMEANRSRKELSDIVEQMLKQAEETDAKEDLEFGADKRGDELPEDLRSTASRKPNLRAAKNRMDRAQQALAKADAKARVLINEYDEKIEKQQTRKAETGKNPAGHKLKPPTEETLNKPKGNLTDPESEIMKGRHGFIQGHNAQLAVDADTQVIVAQTVVSNKNDMALLPPMIENIRQSLTRAQIKDLPQIIAADAGYWTPQSITAAHQTLESISEQSNCTELLVNVPRCWQKLTQVDDRPPPDNLSLHERIEYRVRSPQGQVLYKKRAQSAEPVIGQLKNVRKFDRFTLRGTLKTRGEWALLCATHNIHKLWAHQMRSKN